MLDIRTLSPWCRGVVKSSPPKARTGDAGHIVFSVLNCQPQHDGDSVAFDGSTAAAEITFGEG